MVEEDFVQSTTAVNPWNMETYVHLKERILACIGAMSTCVDAHGGDTCSELREKLEANAFNLVVVGQFKRGKTCLINALLGEDILPMSVVPLTSIVTILAYGKAMGTRVLFNDGRVADIGTKEIGDYVTEAGNPRNVKNVRDVLITYPSPYLKDGVRLIDTPGVGSVYLHNTDAAYQYLPKSDAALFLLSVEQPVSKAELEFLKDVGEYSDRIFFLLNKIDYLSEEEIEQSIAFSRQVINDVMGNDVKIFPISAKLALDGSLQGSDELIQKSNLPSFSRVLDSFLMHEKGQVLLQSVTNGLLRILSQERLAVDLETKSLGTPIEEIKEKIKLFEAKKKEILSDRQGFELLLEGEIEKIKSLLDGDLVRFKEMLSSEMRGKLEACYEEKKQLPLKELDEALETHLIQELQPAFIAWRTGEEEKLSKEFNIACSRFENETNNFVDSLLQFSSELFAVPFEPVAAGSKWAEATRLYYKFKEDPVGLDMLESSITHTLPGLVSTRFEKLRAYLFRMARRRIFNKRRQQMTEAIDMQAGRIRYDFVDRLSRSRAKFSSDASGKLDATIQAIETAIEKGMQIRTQSEEVAEEAEAALAKRLEELNRIKDELMMIRHTVESTDA